MKLLTDTELPMQAELKLDIMLLNRVCPNTEIELPNRAVDLADIELPNVK
jgi:hypothetical protein